MFYLVDGLGSVSETFSDGGTVVATYKYDAWGQTLLNQGDSQNSKGFTGQFATPVSGLDYFNARYYNSTTGTFLTRDSYPGTLDDPASLNRYVYVKDNPLKYTDPTGHYEAGEAASQAGNAGAAGAGDAATDAGYAGAGAAAVYNAPVGFLGEIWNQGLAMVEGIAGKPYDFSEPASAKNDPVSLVLSFNPMLRMSYDYLKGAAITAERNGPKTPPVQSRAHYELLMPGISADVRWCHQLGDSGDRQRRGWRELTGGHVELVSLSPYCRLY